MKVCIVHAYFILLTLLEQFYCYADLFFKENFYYLGEHCSIYLECEHRITSISHHDDFISYSLALGASCEMLHTMINLTTLTFCCLIFLFVSQSVTSINHQPGISSVFVYQWTGDPRSPSGGHFDAHGYNTIPGGEKYVTNESPHAFRVTDDNSNHLSRLIGYNHHYNAPLYTEPIRPELPQSPMVNKPMRHYVETASLSLDYEGPEHPDHHHDEMDETFNLPTATQSTRKTESHIEYEKENDSTPPSPSGHESYVHREMSENVFDHNHNATISPPNFDDLKSEVKEDKNIKM